jgi:hypothetical protein
VHAYSSDQSSGSLVGGEGMLILSVTRCRNAKINNRSGKVYAKLVAATQCSWLRHYATNWKVAGSSPG